MCCLKAFDSNTLRKKGRFISFRIVIAVNFLNVKHICVTFYSQKQPLPPPDSCTVSLLTELPRLQSVLLKSCLPKCESCTFFYFHIVSQLVLCFLQPLLGQVQEHYRRNRTMISASDFSLHFISILRSEKDMIYRVVNSCSLGIWSL